MGMYTRLTMWAELRGYPKGIDALLRWDSDEINPLSTFDHSRGMLNSGSYYHLTRRNSVIRKDNYAGWFLHVDMDMKNYGSEIEHFLDWIHPYVDDVGCSQFAGFMQYEEDETPTLIWYSKAGWVYDTVLKPPGLGDIFDD